MAKSSRPRRPSADVDAIAAAAVPLAIGPDGGDAIFAERSPGAAAGRNGTAYGFTAEAVAAVAAARTAGGAVVDPDRIRPALYRPFCARRLYFDPTVVDVDNGVATAFPKSDSDNAVIVLPDAGRRAKEFAALATARTPDLHLLGGADRCVGYPFFVHDPDGGNRRENISDWAWEAFRTHYRLPTISKWSIFDYVYGMLHHPGYRAAFADRLRREPPRIPLAPDFRAFQQAGQQLLRLHLHYASLPAWDLERVATAPPGAPVSYRVERMRLGRDGTTLRVNDALTLAGIPPEAHDYRPGGRSALQWVIDEYRVRTDPRTGATTADPNRPEDEQSIVRLVGQVVRVSVETVRIIAALPPEFSDAAVAREA